jgi:hypothetical protein
MTLGLELEDIAAQVDPHFLNTPADISPLFPGQRAQLFPRLPADFQPVLHSRSLTNALSSLPAK